MLGDVPIADLRQLIKEAPPGTFFPFSDFVAGAKAMGNRMLALSPHPKNCQTLAISTDLTTLALARVQPRQSKLDLRLGSETSGQAPLDAAAREERQMQNVALQAAEEIAQKFEEGKIQSIEDLRKLLPSSLHRVTLAALKLEGSKKIQLISDSEKIVTGGGKRIPEILESEGKYTVTFEITDGTNETTRTAKVRVISCSPIDVASEDMFEGLGLTLNYVNASDGQVLIAAQLARAKIEAQVSISVATQTNLPTALTLRKIFNGSSIFAAVGAVARQREIDLGV
jgi:hypothetical protein